MAPWELFGLELKYKKNTKISTSAEIKGVFINIYRFYGNSLCQENLLMTEHLFSLDCFIIIFLKLESLRCIVSTENVIPLLESTTLISSQDHNIFFLTAIAFHSVVLDWKKTKRGKWTWTDACNQDHFIEYVEFERFSIVCCNAKTKVITLANHRGIRQYSEPIKPRSNYM